MWRCFIIWLFLCVQVYATPVHLGWDQNTESNLLGYKIYASSTQGTGYYQIADILLSDLSNPQDPDYWVDISYDTYLVATAYSSTDESGYSNELFYTQTGMSPSPATNLTILYEEPGLMACDVKEQSEETTTLTNCALAQYSSSKYVATKFVYSGTDNKGICAIDIHGQKVGSPTMNITVEIRGDSGGTDPDDTVYSTGGTQAASGFPANGSPDWVSFTGLTVNTNLTNGNTYWLLAYGSAYDSSNYIQLSADTGATTEKVVRDADGTGDWADLYADRSLCFKLFSEAGGAGLSIPILMQQMNQFNGGSYL